MVDKINELALEQEECYFTVKVESFYMTGLVFKGIIQDVNGNMRIDDIEHLNLPINVTFNEKDIESVTCKIVNRFLAYEIKFINDITLFIDSIGYLEETAGDE
jgi:hypothetical protein